RRTSLLPGAAVADFVPKRQTPRAIADFDRGDDARGNQVDYRNVVRQSVRGVEAAAVGGDGDAPRALADGDEALDAVRGGVDDGDAVAASGGDVEVLLVRRKDEADRMVRAAEPDVRGDAVLPRVEHVHAAGDFARDVGAPAVAGEEHAARPRVDEDVRHDLRGLRVDHA